MSARTLLRLHLALLLAALLAWTSVALPVAQAKQFGGGLNCAGLAGVVCTTASDYGIDPTGTNDSAAAFGVAMSDAASRGANAALYIPSGTYKLNSTLTVRANLMLIGAGPSATILQAGAALSGDVIANASSAGGITLAELQVNGNRTVATSSSHCVDFANADVFAFEDVQATACNGDGIRLNGVNRVQLTNVSSYANTANGLDVLGASTYAQASNSRFYDNGITSGSGVTIGGTSTYTTLANIAAFDDQGGSATQLYPVTESGSANFSKIAGLAATGNVTSNAPNLIGANSLYLDAGNFANPTVSGTCSTTSGLLGFASNYLCYGTGTAAANVAGINIANTWSAAQTFNASGALDLSALGASSFRLPVAAGAAPTVDGKLAFDSTAHRPVIGENGTSQTLATLAGTETLTNKSIAASEINSGQLAVSNGGTGVGSSPTYGFSYANGVSLSTLTNSLGASVTLSNTASYFDGPSVAQGTSGTWCGTGVITVTAGTSGGDSMYAKLWDGTTVIDSVATNAKAASALISMTLYGCLASPAGNIRVSVRDLISTDAAITANTTGNSKDSTLTVVRVA